MLLIPEIQKVVILVPRTGSGSLYRAVLKMYPKAMLIYRHMEADGVPRGYDHWEKLGVVRDPVDRLWSLYKFLQNFDGPHDPAYLESMRSSVQVSFSDWILHNQVVFTNPYDSAGLGRYFPRYTVNHPLPENRKSQYMYLRPDLGTAIYQYSELPTLEKALGVELGRVNRTASVGSPKISRDALNYLRRVFAWDFEVTKPHEMAPEFVENELLKTS